MARERRRVQGIISCINDSELKRKPDAEIQKKTHTLIYAVNWCDQAMQDVVGHGTNYHTCSHTIYGEDEKACRDAKRKSASRGGKEPQHK